MPKYTIILNKQVIKFLAKHTSIIGKFKLLTQQLSINPYTNGLPTKRLQGDENGSWRLRIGKYRFKYIVDKSSITITMYEAGSRGDIYT